MTATEKRYAQVEKEALALTWACKRFHDFVYGLYFMPETTHDHKPLLSVLRVKNLDELSPRLQRMRMRLMHYDYDIHYTPGKDIIAADDLSHHNWLATLMSRTLHRNVKLMYLLF